jgi:TPP-dependent pyruvate/acetoin dehydrogenase alpha subunit
VLERGRQADPIAKLEALLRDRDVGAAELETVVGAAERELAEALARAERMPAPDPSTALADAYA